MALFTRSHTLSFPLLIIGRSHLGDAREAHTIHYGRCAALLPRDNGGLGAHGLTHSSPQQFLAATGLKKACSRDIQKVGISRFLRLALRSQDDVKPKSDLVALSELGSAMAANQFASLEIEQDTGSTSHANTESIDVIELDGVVRAGSLNSGAA